MPTCPLTCPKVKRELRRALEEGRFTPDGKPVHRYRPIQGKPYDYAPKGSDQVVRKDVSGIYRHPDGRYSPGTQRIEVPSRDIDYDTEWPGGADQHPYEKPRLTSAAPSAASRRTAAGYSPRASGQAIVDERSKNNVTETRTPISGIRTPHSTIAPSEQMQVPGASTPTSGSQNVGRRMPMPIQNGSRTAASLHGIPEGTQTPGMHPTVSRGHTPSSTGPGSYKETGASVSVSYADAEASYHPPVTTTGVGADPRYVIEAGQQTPAVDSSRGIQSEVSHRRKQLNGVISGKEARERKGSGTAHDARAYREARSADTARGSYGTTHPGNVARESYESRPQQLYDSLPHASCESNCSMERKREMAVRRMERRQRDVDHYYLTKGYQYFDDVCTCSLSCMFHCLKRDRFVKSILASAAVFALGMKLCEEMKNWFVTTVPS